MHSPRQRGGGRFHGLGGMYTDPACAGSLAKAAVKDLHAAQTAAGTQMAPGFRRLALKQLVQTD